MVDEDDIIESIAENAVGPKKASGDTGSIENYGIDEQIQAADYVKENRSATRKTRAIGFSRAVPPGGGPN